MDSGFLFVVVPHTHPTSLSFPLYKLRNLGQKNTGGLGGKVIPVYSLIN